MKRNSNNPDKREQAFKQYHARLITIIYRVTGSEADAEDITSHSFEKLCNHRNIESMTMAEIEAFLRETAKNKTIDYWRKESSRTKYLNSAEAKVAQAYEEEWAIENLLAEYYDEVKEAVADLPGRQREVLALFYFENKSAAEISDLLNISVNTVYNTLSDAKENLRKKLRTWRRF
jgi:RNA polymerase sigma factor (sigma-70 family)